MKTQLPWRRLIAASLAAPAIFLVFTALDFLDVADVGMSFFAVIAVIYLVALIIWVVAGIPNQPSSDGQPIDRPVIKVICVTLGGMVVGWLIWSVTALAVVMFMSSIDSGH